MDNSSWIARAYRAAGWALWCVSRQRCRTGRKDSSPVGCLRWGTSDPESSAKQVVSAVPAAFSAAETSFLELVPQRTRAEAVVLLQLLRLLGCGGE